MQSTECPHHAGGMEGSGPTFMVVDCVFSTRNSGVNRHFIDITSLQTSPHLYKCFGFFESNR